MYLIKLTPEPARFIRGDVNADGSVDISDAICIIYYLFGPPSDPCKQKVARCRDAADANDDGTIDSSDAIRVLNRLFFAGAPLPPPFTACGYDESEDELRCSFCAPCE